MSRVASSIPNLFNGISQQADVLRLPTQGEEQFNMYPSLVQGLVKRPPLEYVTDILSMKEDSPMKGTLHLADRGGSVQGRSRFLLYATPEGLHIYNLDRSGNKPLYYEGSAKDYLRRDGCDGDYEITTIADHTFIVNPKVKVKMLDAVRSPGYLNAGIINVKQASYETDYRVTVVISYKDEEGQTKTDLRHVGYTTPSSMGTVENPPPRISTQEIAGALADSLTSSGETRINAKKDGSSINLFMKEGVKLVSLEVKDSRGDTHMTAFSRTVKRFSDLPAHAPEGMTVKVTGSDTTRFNDYYVRYETPAGELDGTWKECPAPDIRTSLDPSTLPHVLVDNGDVFIFKPYNQWGRRVAGDEETAPDPEFVGQPVTGIFQYRNRLGLLSQDVVALSEASEFFNFFPTTVVTAVDSDPIFLSASLDGAPELRHAVPFNEEIILFSDRSQYKITAPEVLSPSTAAVNVLTKYPLNTAIKPVNSGKNIFFVNTPAGGNPQVYEYLLDADTGTKAAMDITAHVPQYLDHGISGMTCSPGLNLLCLHSFSCSEAWLYKYYWSGQEKLQAAWFKIGVGENRKLYGAVFVDDQLYLLLRIDDKKNILHLCRMDFSKTLLGAGVLSSSDSKDSSFTPFLDMLSEDYIDGQYNHDQDLTEYTLREPYSMYFNGDRIIFLDYEKNTELRPFLAYPQAKRYLFRGDVRDKHIRLGESYPAHYTFTRAFVRHKGQGGEGQLTVQSGRLQLRKWRLILGPTGFIEVEVQHSDGRAFLYPWTPPRLSGAGHKLGRANIPIYGTLDVPVRSNASEASITIRNNSWLPSSVISAEWEGNFITKGLQSV